MMDILSGQWSVVSGQSNPQSRIHHPLSTIHHSSRRGVLLLMILALLAMFGLIAVAFVVLTGHAKRDARTVQRIDLVTDPPQKTLQQAAMQILRGSNNTASVIGAHSLLEDMYGNNAATGTITIVSNTVCGGQLIEFTFAWSAGATTPAVRTGCVITITGPTTSPAYGQSSRIVGFNPTGDLSGTATGPWQMLAFDGGGQPQTGDTVIISGVPFSGTGFGYNPTTAKMDLAFDPTASPPDITAIPSALTWPVALLPNMPLATYYSAVPSALKNPFSNPPGGVNSDYTAADFQHMLLAAQIPPTIPGGPVQTLPSLHRPALVNYWMNQPQWATSPDLPRKVIMRPIGPITGLTLPTGFVADHPNFTGSNSNPAGFNPLLGPWDVDNDGDGVPDSVWVDPGLPVRSTSDGRLYKPLIAVLCVDLDGRLNLNAHGSLVQADSNYGTLQFAGQFAGGVTPTLARGQGLGPAEINLSGILTGATYQQLLAGNGGTYEGRYGTDGTPASAALAPDPLTANKWFEYGRNYWDFSNANNAGSYGTPPDPFGVGAVGLDVGGRPIYAGMNYRGSVYLGMGSDFVDTMTPMNSPYAMNLGPRASRGLSSLSGAPDNPFSVAELERVLRPYDRDATTLPARLASLTSTTGLPQNSLLIPQRLNVTTESWDVPVPATTVPAGAAAGHITETLLSLLVQKGIPRATAVTLLPTLLPPDLLAGLKMNINRPFGNGRDYIATAGDDATNAGSIDAPGTQHQLTLYKSPTATAAVNVSYDPTGTVATNSQQARESRSPVPVRFGYTVG